MDSANLVLMQTNPVQESPNHFVLRLGQSRP
jgi:hypothetical protein